MKRIASLLLAIVLLFALAACAKQDKADTSGSGSGSSSGSSSDSSKPASSGTSSSGNASDKSENAPKQDASIEGATTISDLTSLEDIMNMEVHPSDDARYVFAFHGSCEALQYIGGPDSGQLMPASLFYETPMIWDSVQSKVLPWLVTEWEWIDDLTLRCKMQEGVTSLMGDPYTANDFYYTLDWQCHNPAITTFFGIIDFDNCKVIDDYTIDIAVNSPYPFLELEMTSSSWSQVVEASVEKIGGKEATKDDERSGTGAYYVTDWKPGQYIYTERRDDYWGQTPYFKYIDTVCVNDANTRAMGLEAGDYDLSTSISSITLENATQSDSLNALSSVSTSSCYSFVFNSDREPFNILEVRQAMAMAIDYQTMVDIALRGFGDVSDATVCPPANPLYFPVSDPDKNFIKFDLDAAKQKLVEAGYPDGFSCTCLYRNVEAVSVTIAELLQNMMKQVGIDMELIQCESAVFTTMTREADYDTMFSQAANPSPMRFLQAVDPRVGFIGVSGYCGDQWYGDYDIESLVDKCAYTLDEAERNAAWKELNDLARERVPKLILMGCWRTAVSTKKIDAYLCTAYGAPYIWSCYANEYIGK